MVFATGVAMLVSALYVRYRDMQPIWEVALQILFYASPVIYVTTFLPGQHRERRRWPIRSPRSSPRCATRVIDPDAPTAADLIGGDGAAADPAGVVVALSFALGLWVFTREAPRIAEDL